MWLGDHHPATFLHVKFPQQLNMGICVVGPSRHPAVSRAKRHSLLHLGHPHHAAAAAEVTPGWRGHHAAAAAEVTPGSQDQGQTF